MTRACVRLAVLALTAASTVLAMTALPAASVGAVPRQATSPETKPIGLHQLMAVSAASPDSAIASGENLLGHSTPVENWDGTAWQESSGLDASFLISDVAAFSAKDAWAVGSDSTHPIMEHWNGQKWRGYEGPSQRYYAFFAGVTMFSPRDVWAAGYGQSYEEGPYFTLIEHWDGKSWTVVPSPTPNPDYTTLSEITGTSDHDVWVAGEAGGTFFMHWDGSAWTTFDSPAGGVTQGMASVSSDDVWAVGRAWDEKRDKSAQFIERWDGQTWSVVPTPKIKGIGTQLTGISAVSANDVWAVGSTLGLNQYYQPHVGRSFIEHWDGQAWSRVDIHHPGTDFDALEDVSADSPNDAWAVGFAGNYDQWGNDQTANYLMHWDGTGWTRVRG